MKYAVVIPDGVADEPTDQLGGHTPLQVAHTPTLDELARQGLLGTAPLCDDVPGSPASALLEVVGYHPPRYPAGAGALLASGLDFRLQTGEQPLCASLVTIIDDVMQDPFGGLIPRAQATSLLESLSEAFAADGFRFQIGDGGRNLCVWESAPRLDNLRTNPPETLTLQPIKRWLPRGNGSKTLRQIMDAAGAILRTHDVNLVRGDLGENTADSLWLWGQGPLPSMPAFSERFGVSGCLVGGDGITRGIARLIGWDLVGATGTEDPTSADLADLGRAAAEELDSHELVCVHVRAPCRSVMAEDVATKVSAIEALDHDVISPILKRLQREGSWRVMVIPGWSGRGSNADLGDHAPLVIAGSGIESNRGEAYDEDNADEGEIHPDRAADLMEYFLRR